MTPQMDFI